MTDLEVVNCVYQKSQFERKLTSFSMYQSLRHLIHSRRRKMSTLTNVSERSTVAGNVALLPVDVTFALLSSQRLLPESAFIVRRHVTSK